MRKLTRASFGVLFVFAGCGDSVGAIGVTPDLTVGADLAMPDLAMPDLARPDLAMPDLAMPDLAMPDLAMPDLAMPDLAMPDFAMPDFAMPDLAHPDLALPDLARPDFSLPDFALPDLATPDLSQPDFRAYTCNGLHADVASWLSEHASCQSDNDCTWLSTACGLDAQCGAALNSSAAGAYLTLLENNWLGMSCQPMASSGSDPCSCSHNPPPVACCSGTCMMGGCPLRAPKSPVANPAKL